MHPLVMLTVSKIGGGCDGPLMFLSSRVWIWDKTKNWKITLFLILFYLCQDMLCSVKSNLSDRLEAKAMHLWHQDWHLHNSLMMENTWARNRWFWPTVSKQLLNIWEPQLNFWLLLSGARCNSNFHIKGLCNWTHVNPTQLTLQNTWPIGSILGDWESSCTWPARCFFMHSGYFKAINLDFFTSNFYNRANTNSISFS